MGLQQNAWPLQRDKTSKHMFFWAAENISNTQSSGSVTPDEPEPASVILGSQQYHWDKPRNHEAGAWGTPVQMTKHRLELLDLNTVIFNSTLGHRD